MTRLAIAFVFATLLVPGDAALTVVSLGKSS
jgi:hypothetical protein